ncbi:MAG: enoyl-CoA hydratase/isomerase family protein [Firmicutes bacterium]|nr:enoyl-CoA hydratase/isomerase family protein [Bacillota bacterium]
MGYETVIYEKVGFVGKITLNRPDRMNAINSVLATELKEVIEKVSQDNEVRTVVITGNPRVREKDGKTEIRYCFSAGWDLSEASAIESPAEVIAALEVPVIAMVNGFALGGGCEIALACDFIYVSDNSELGLPEINRGLLPGWGGTQRLPRRIGVAKAKKMILTGDLAGGQEAAEIGLADVSVPMEQLEETVMAFAEKLASKAPLGLRKVKEAVDRGSDTDMKTGLQYEQEALGFLTGTEDFQEGIAAFMQKRDPVWKGK